MNIAQNMLNYRFAATGRIDWVVIELAAKMDSNEVIRELDANNLRATTK